MVQKENGFVFDSRRAETAAEGIEYMMGMDGAEREKMGEACRRSVRRFDRKHTNEIMKSVYEEVKENE